MLISDTFTFFFFLLKDIFLGCEKSCQGKKKKMKLFRCGFCFEPQEMGNGLMIILFSFLLQLQLIFIRTMSIRKRVSVSINELRCAGAYDKFINIRALKCTDSPQFSAIFFVSYLYD